MTPVCVKLVRTQSLRLSKYGDINEKDEHNNSLGNFTKDIRRNKMGNGEQWLSDVLRNKINGWDFLGCFDIRENKTIPPYFRVSPLQKYWVSYMCARV